MPNEPIPEEQPTKVEPAEALPDAEPATPSQPAPTVQLVRKHPLAVRWLHWINFPVLFLMIWSGILILWAYDAYPTERFKFNVPDQITLFRGVSIQVGFQLAKGMALHFNLAWIFTLNGVAYACFLAFSGQWRHIVPRRESFGEAIKVVLHDIGLWKKPLPPGKYNHAQRIAYSGVIFLGILMVVNGLAIYKPAQLSWLVALFGGYQTARLIHFLITWLFLAFFVVHVAQVVRAGWNNLRGMLTGYELKRPEPAGREESA